MQNGLINAERENKGESKKQIKTNKELFFFKFHSELISLLGQLIVKRDPSQHCLINEPFSSERGTVRQGGTKKKKKNLT